MSFSPPLPSALFAPTLIAWQKQYGRQSLPWQHTRDPYRIWLSEIMLQQTQVATVIDYYVRFTTRFPTLESLAEAPLDDVLALWAGLGYYTRARNLHACAKQVVARYEGRFPEEPDKLMTLPGIGRSTAAAISAFAYGTRAAILDGNVKRVLTRIWGIEGYPGEKKIENRLWLLAESLLPPAEMAAYTQGLMDLGATLCTRSKPSCEQCPFALACVAKRDGLVADIPTRKPGKVLPEKQVTMWLIVCQQQIWLQRRPPTGIWGGLWSLPETLSEDKHRSAPMPLLPGTLDKQHPLPQLTHTFTHFKLHITPVCVTLRDAVVPVGSLQNGRWWRLDQLSEIGLPRPIEKIIHAWQTTVDDKNGKK